MPAVPADSLRSDTLDLLRQRTSAKWRTYPNDVLPLFVAEMDYPLAAPLAAAFRAVIERSDVGYIGSPDAVGTAFSSFAATRWGWSIDATGIRTTTDVSVAIVETLRQAVAPGSAIVIMPPVYAPFFELVPEAGCVVVEVPLNDDGETYSIDLDGLERAFEAGAKGVLLCNPHNPLGLVHTRETLSAVAALAERYGAIVVSDEIHGPLVHPGVTFTPYLSVSDAARRHAVAVTSASKGWNVAGAKCALMVAAGPEMLALLDAMPAEVSMRTSQFGLHGSVAAFTDGEPWLDGALACIGRSADLLEELLAEQLPEVRFRRPQASYLAWLDFRALAWGDDPSIRALEEAAVALNPGPSFGSPGRGFARLNLACSAEVLTEAVRRLASAEAAAGAGRGTDR